MWQPAPEALRKPTVPFGPRMCLVLPCQFSPTAFMLLSKCKTFSGTNHHRAPEFRLPATMHIWIIWINQVLGSSACTLEKANGEERNDCGYLPSAWPRHDPVTSIVATCNVFSSDPNQKIKNFRTRIEKHEKTLENMRKLRNALAGLPFEELSAWEWDFVHLSWSTKIPSCA